MELVLVEIVCECNMDERTTAQYWWTGGIKFAELAVRPDTGLFVLPSGLLPNWTDSIN